MREHRVRILREQRDDTALWILPNIYDGVTHPDIYYHRISLGKENAPEGFPLELHAMAAIENSDKKIATEHRAAKIKIGFESE